MCLRWHSLGFTISTTECIRSDEAGLAHFIRRGLRHKLRHECQLFGLAKTTAKTIYLEYRVISISIQVEGSISDLSSRVLGLLRIVWPKHIRGFPLIME